jgi:glycosidase
MVWPELTYEPEASHPLGKPRPVDEVKFDHDLFAWYKKLIHIRRAHAVLALGEVDFFQIDVAARWVAFRRTLGKDQMFVLVNNRDAETVREADLSAFGVRQPLRDLITGESFSGENGRYRIEMAAYQVRILTK